MKKIFFLTVLTIFGSYAFAQKVNGTLKGHLVDSASQQGLPDATLSVMSAADSTLVSFTLTSNSGYFEIKKLDEGAYYIIVSYQGFETLKKGFSITAQDPVADLQSVKMHQSYKTLDEVVVTNEAPIQIKGDTLAYNAGSFKTKPNATVEDLLKKLPGVQVDRDGTVKAQGENVQKVYVDGKEFFGNDPKMATKNLAADMIDKVEVYDDMSDQAKFNGIDDGSRTKAINLKLKKEKKRGLFGRLTAGYGTDARYNANFRTNFFKGATQLTVLASGNNNNNQNFTSTDMLGMSFGGGGGGMMGGGGRMMVGGGMSMGGMSGGMASGGNGITTTRSVGANYNDTWSKAIDISSSYNYNQGNTDNLRNSYRQNFATFNNTEYQNSFSNNINDVHRMTMRLNYSMNEKNSIVYSSNLTFQNTESYRNDTTSQFRLVDQILRKRNESSAFLTNNGEGMNWNNNLIWRKKFAKSGRTFSLNFNNTISKSDRLGSNNSLFSNFNNAGVKMQDSTINQRNINNSDNNNYGLTLSYTEPIGRNKIWEINYGYTKNGSESDRETFDFNPLTSKYDRVVDSFTNIFHNINESHRAGTNFRVVNKKYNYQVGVSAQRTVIESDNLSKNTFIDYSFVNIIPTASFNYQFARSRNLRFNYRGRTNPPNINQLQPVPDNTSNSRNIRQGNPDLGQEYSNNFSLNYSFFDPMRFRNIFAYVSFNNTYNKIVNSTQIIDSFGTQLTKPVNTDGVFGVNGNFNIGFPIKRMQGGNFNATTRVSFNRDASFLGEDKNYIKNLTIGEDLRLNYNYKEKLDLGVTASINYTSASYTLQKLQAQNTNYYTHVYSADVSYTLPKGFIISTDIDFTANTGRSDGFNQKFTLWNAGFAKQLFKDKRGELKLSAFDLLNQNRSLVRNATSDYIEDVETNVIKRFFMLSFTYNINRMGGKAMPAGGGGRSSRTIISQ